VSGFASSALAASAPKLMPDLPPVDPVGGAGLTQTPSHIVEIDAHCSALFTAAIGDGHLLNEHRVAATPPLRAATGVNGSGVPGFPPRARIGRRICRGLCRGVGSEPSGTVRGFQKGRSGPGTFVGNPSRKGAAQRRLFRCADSPRQWQFGNRLATATLAPRGMLSQCAAGCRGARSP
jgi:hypothetical protein